MKDWEGGIRDGFVLDFAVPFDQSVETLKSKKGGSFKYGSHNYYVLAALFRGDVIDDYAHPPLNDEGRVIRNIPARVAELRCHWNISILSRKVEKKPYTQYRIDRSDNVGE